ncbi:putative comE operon protein 1 [Oceanococcus atlanticus]|uniref:Putative comE operon protein 1 n=2 Tax=Oceanococcus atlanticus TaxID=1317117 RepID=A0A1Y1SIM1_9GAMM|nr:putative comE operon protein 1 [Oceanococcus atlanticus]
MLLAVLIHTWVWAAPVNINTASRERLDEELSGIGSVLADRIVRYREAHGPFRSPDEIQNVPYIGVKTFEKNRQRIQVQD